MKEESDRAKAITLLQQHARQIIWKKAFIVATVATFFIYWWTKGGLPSVREFLPIFAGVFIPAYFVLTWSISHYAEPINRTVISYIQKNCPADSDSDSFSQWSSK